jgi:hypothetical protein
LHLLQILEAIWQPGDCRSEQTIFRLHPFRGLPSDAQVATDRPADRRTAGCDATVGTEKA